MKKEQIDQLITMTREGIESYYHGDSSLLFFHLHENCIWIGACDQFYIGKNRIMQAITDLMPELPPIDLVEQEYFCAGHDRSSCTVAGRYLAMTEPDSGKLLREVQRLTFFWKEENGEPLIQHMHVSNATLMTLDGEQFSHRVGRSMYRYLQKLLRDKCAKQKKLCIRSMDSSYCYIPVDEIISLEAFNQKTLIHTTGGDMEARGLLAELAGVLEQLEPGLFLRIHRSFVVNRYYVTRLKRYEVFIGEKYQYAVSKERYHQIREELKNS